MSGTTWQALADECRLMDAGEGWAFAERVACAVEKGKGSGGDPATRHLREREGGKTSAAEFAARWGTSTDRVLRYLNAWDTEARKHGVSTSAELTPSDQGTVAYDGVFPRWKHNQMQLGSKTSDREPGAQKVADVKNNAASVAKALADPAFARKVSGEMDSSTAEGVYDAVVPKLRHGDTPRVALPDMDPWSEALSVMGLIRRNTRRLADLLDETRMSAHREEEINEWVADITSEIRELRTKEGRAQLKLVVGGEEG
jgi:hypothetical protein